MGTGRSGVKSQWLRMSKQVCLLGEILTQIKKFIS